jgi:hypothetical protein
MSSVSDRWFYVGCALWVVSCGGGAPPAAAPAPTVGTNAPAQPSGPSVDLEMQGAEAESEPEPKSSTPEPKAPAAATGESGKAPPASEPPAAESAATRRPIDVLTGPNVAFIVDYQNSQPQETAERACDSEAGDDGAARAECMKKARAAFRADVLHFKKDAQGRFWLTVYERKGSALPELYKARVEFADETASSVSVRLKEEKGTRPLFVGASKITLSVPNDYALELNDPKYGKLVYGAKVGLVGDR